MKIYVPNVSDYACITIRNDSTIRAYKQTPRINSTINYDDYYYDSHYYYTSGEQTFSQYSVLPTCISNDDLTDSVYYRNDFWQISVLFLVLCIFIFYIPLRLFGRLHRRNR